MEKFCVCVWMEQRDFGERGKIKGLLSHGRLCRCCCCEEDVCVVPVVVYMLHTPVNSVASAVVLLWGLTRTRPQTETTTSLPESDSIAFALLLRTELCVCVWSRALSEFQLLL